MKHLVIILFLTAGLHANSQALDGVYKSSNSSFRENFILKVEGDRITVFGWEVTMNDDTVYFRSSTRLGTKGRLKFEKFDYSKIKTTESNLTNFIPDDDIEDDFFPYDYWQIIEWDGGKITLTATKKDYDSKLDTFQFDIIK